MSLKDIFRPTGSRVAWALSIGIPLTLAGAGLGALFPHPTTEIDLVRTILLLGDAPLRLTQNWKLPDWLWIVLAWSLNLLYYYIAVSLVLHILERAKASQR